MREKRGKKKMTFELTNKYGRTMIEIAKNRYHLQKRINSGELYKIVKVKRIDKLPFKDWLIEYRQWRGDKCVVVSTTCQARTEYEALSWYRVHWDTYLNAYENNPLSIKEVKTK